MRGFKEVMIAAEVTIEKLNTEKNSAKKPLDRVCTDEARALLGDEFREWLYAVNSDDEIQELADIIACASILVNRLQEAEQWKTRNENPT